MASEVAHSDNARIDDLPSSVNDVPMTNGDHEVTSAGDAPVNAAAFTENAAHTKSDPSANNNNNSQSASDPEQTDAAPIENVSAGIAPVADFLPKNAPTSHPTPPPDEPLATSEVNADTDMVTPDEQSAASDVNLPSSTEAAPVISSTESSLIRPREDDDESDGPAAKRSKVDDLPMEDIPIRDAPATTVPEEKSGEVNQALATDDVGEENAQEPANSLVPEAEPDSSAVAPLETSSEPTSVKTETKPSTEALEGVSQTAVAASTAPTYSRDPITPAQSKYLQEKMKNLKKTKNSAAFLMPVDPVALNIPSYAEIVTSPMDLTTMENKLRNGEYASIQAFSDDFDLIILNTRRFNGEAHAVTQAGLAMEAYFRKILESAPRTDQPVPQKIQTKKQSPKPPAPRRESRSAVVATSPTNNTAAGPTFALQANGTPQIRRDSTINRPTRAIKPPQNREISYAKPKRKETQVELKFCDHVLGQMRGPKYAHINSVFQQPVDPVALNIPHYRQVVKHPMDLSTISNKLKQGEYAKAAEFKKDFDLMIQNCLVFNPPGNAVRDMGIQFQRVFEDLWRSREKWERGRKAETQRAASASADDDSGDEEEEEEEEEDGVPEDQAGTIKALQKQLAEMQNALAGLGKAPTKQKKTKTASKPGKKASAVPTSKAKPAPKAKTSKKPKQVTYEEKQEISEAVGKMNNPQIEELTRIITTNCKKYADQEEMELEIDDLPNDVQVMLLQYVRGLFGNPHKRHRAASPDDIAAVDDDDFEPDRKGRGGGGKRKKHKPMGKKEQQDAISSIQAQLRQFQNVATSGSESPTNSNAAANQGADSSDDESEESEEE